MKQIILYNLSEKDNAKRSRILQKLYGYTDKSNYDYSYKRQGELKNIKYRKEKKTVLYFNNEKELKKAEKVLKSLKLRFETAYF